MDVLQLLLSADFSIFNIAIDYGFTGGVPFINIGGFDVLSPVTNAIGDFIPVLRTIMGSVLDVILGFWFVQQLPSIIRGKPDIPPPVLMFHDPLQQMDDFASEVLNF